MVDYLNFRLKNKNMITNKTLCKVDAVVLDQIHLSIMDMDDLMVDIQAELKILSMFEDEITENQAIKDVVLEAGLINTINRFKKAIGALELKLGESYSNMKEL